MLPYRKRFALVTLLAIFAIAPLSADTVGWRTDATGRYPEADPPAKWSDTENVVWKIDLPSWGNASPVIVGDRIFVTSEPSDLICLDKATGRILWTQSSLYEDLLTDEQRAAIAAGEAELAELRTQLQPLRRELGQIRQQLRQNQRDAELTARRDELQEQMRAINERIAPLIEHHRAPAHNTNGYASPTPVSDGQRVFALFGTGVVAAFDLDGNALWKRFIEKPHDAWGHSASPVLVDGRLIVHIHDVHALDPDTGKTLWKVEAKPAWGTGIAATVRQQAAYITPLGDIIRAEDGEAIARGVSKLEYAAPILSDGIVYFIENGGAAIRLATDADAGEPVETLWTTTPHRDRYYASAVLHEGLIYAITRANRFSVIDAETGELVYARDLGELGRGAPYPSITMAGKNIYVSSDNGTTLVLNPGREFDVAEHNTLEPFRTTPVFEGGRMYIRTRERMFCIGR